MRTASPEVVACSGDRQAAYAFLYPNLMINRYGPWLDTNVVTPTGPESCTVRFDWWLEGGPCGDEAIIERSIADSEQVSTPHTSSTERICLQIERHYSQLGPCLGWRMQSNRLSLSCKVLTVLCRENAAASKPALASCVTHGA